MVADNVLVKCGNYPFRSTSIGSGPEPVSGCTLHRALLQAGVLTNMVLFPAVPPGEAMLRVSVMATHTREHLDRGLSIFESIGRQLGIVGPRAELRRLLEARNGVANTNGHAGQLTK